MTKQPENVDSKNANLSSNREPCVPCYAESSIVSLRGPSPRCCSFSFRRRKVRPKSDADNWRMEGKELNPCWEFLGGLGLEEGFVKLNSLLLNSRSPTHCALPNFSQLALTYRGR